MTDTAEIIPIGGSNPDGSPSYIGAWTFQCYQVRRLVEEHITGRTLNACAGKTKLDHDGEVIRNDINPDREADTHVDVADIDEAFDPESFDSVVFDPPFDQKQAEEHYQSMHARTKAPAREKLAELVRPGGVFVELGWGLCGVSSKVGWGRTEAYLFDRQGDRPPVLMTVDVLGQTRLGVSP